jgi:sulfite exporter TauE/SafE
MVEGLMSILIIGFITLVFGLVYQQHTVIIPQILIIIITLYLLIRVRVKIARAEKEKLKAKIEDLEAKIMSFSKKEE